MKEIYVPFSGPMVRANMEGRKNQTRRLVKGQEAVRGTYTNPHVNHQGFLTWCHVTSPDIPNYRWNRSPFGQAGDILCVKEAIQKSSHGYTVYSIDSDPCRKARNVAHEWNWKVNKLIPRYMPHWACRSKYLITSVEVQKLDQTTDADAINEGIEQIQIGGDLLWKDYSPGSDDFPGGFSSPLESYKSLWDSLHPDHPFDGNWWVWVVKYRT